MKKRLKISTKDIAVAAIFLAFILVFLLIPFPNFGVDMAVFALLAVCIAVSVKGFGMGLFTGIAFGLASLLKAFVRPNWTSPIFYNPMVSVFPRIIIPITTYFTFRFVKKLMRKKTNEVSTLVASTASTIVAVCTNTFLVLGMWAAFYLGDTFTDTAAGTSKTITWALFAGIISSNFIIELIICTALAPTICLALRLALRIDRRGRRDVEAITAASQMAEAEDVTVPAENASEIKEDLSKIAEVREGETDSSEE